MNGANLIKNKDREKLMMGLSEGDDQSLDETAYLSRSPENLKRLLEALSRKEGKTLEEVQEMLNEGCHSGA